MRCRTGVNESEMAADHCYESFGGPSLLTLRVNEHDVIEIYCSKAELGSLIQELQEAYDESPVKR